MQSMLKKDFWYDLPKELIAQEPADPRDSARLMVLSQKDDSIQHKIFHDLPEFLEPGDLLVVNNSKVLPARIVGVKQPTGAVCELLLLRQVKGDQWECLAKPGKRMQPGTKVSFGDGSLTAVVDETMEDGNKYVTFYYDTETLYEKLDEFGKMPLPPYITKQLEDQSQYQTVYAKELGSAAAPTAGLHFTPELMDTIRFVRDNFDMTILLIEHDMKLVSGICEELTVLNFGHVLRQGKTSDVLHDPEVIKAYLGE